MDSWLVLRSVFYTSPHWQKLVPFCLLLLFHISHSSIFPLLFFSIFPSFHEKCPFFKSVLSISILSIFSIILLFLSSSVRQSWRESIVLILPLIHQSIIILLPLALSVNHHHHPPRSSPSILFFVPQKKIKMSLGNQWNKFVSTQTASAHTTTPSAPEPLRNSHNVATKTGHLGELAQLLNTSTTWKATSGCIVSEPLRNNPDLRAALPSLKPKPILPSPERRTLSPSPRKPRNPIWKNHSQHAISLCVRAMDPQEPNRLNINLGCVKSIACVRLPVQEEPRKLTTPWSCHGLMLHTCMDPQILANCNLHVPTRSNWIPSTHANFFSLRRSKLWRWWVVPEMLETFH